MISIVLVGTSGMGSVYTAELLKNKKTNIYKIAGVVDPNPERCPQFEELRSRRIPIRGTLEEFYEGRRAELAVISSPVHFHCEQTCLALARGSHVLCEQPAAATVQDVLTMIKARDRAGRWVGVGYEWSFGSAIQELKVDILAGRYGKAQRLKCLYLWPRDESYYLDNNWAGRRRDDEGRWILDSPSNNAMAQDLHNMFYVLGRRQELSSRPIEVEAELYRAYPIENFDTVASRVKTEEGAEILLYASHACSSDTGPVFSYDFEQGTVFGRGRGSDIAAYFDDDAVKNYGNPDAQPLKKLWDAIRAAGTGQPPVCGLEAALSQTVCVNGIQDSVPEITDIPRSLIEMEGAAGHRSVRVHELDKILTECYRRNILPSEAGVPWSKRGRKIDLEDYSFFPSA